MLRWDRGMQLLALLAERPPLRPERSFGLPLRQLGAGEPADGPRRMPIASSMSSCLRWRMQAAAPMAAPPSTSGRRPDRSPPMAAIRPQWLSGRTRSPKGIRSRAAPDRPRYPAPEELAQPVVDQDGLWILPGSGPSTAMTGCLVGPASPGRIGTTSVSPWTACSPKLASSPSNRCRAFGNPWHWASRSTPRWVTTPGRPAGRAVCKALEAVGTPSAQLDLYVFQRLEDTPARVTGTVIDELGPPDSPSPAALAWGDELSIRLLAVNAGPLADEVTSPGVREETKTLNAAQLRSIRGIRKKSLSGLRGRAEGHDRICGGRARRKHGRWLRHPGDAGGLERAPEATRFRSPGARWRRRASCPRSVLTSVGPPSAATLEASAAARRSATACGCSACCRWSTFRRSYSRRR